VWYYNSTTTGMEGDGGNNGRSPSDSKVDEITNKKMKVTMDNLPFGHICDDIAVDNDTPYVRVYCQNVCGIYDREGIGLDLTFKEVTQAEEQTFSC
jgi:hypothetical protein